MPESLLCQDVMCAGIDQVSRKNTQHLSSYCLFLYLCLFPAMEAFEEAGNILSGHVRMGMYFEDDALAL